MTLFSGIIKVKVIEAESLKATDYSTRIFQNSFKGFCVSPYVSLDVDDVPIGRTQTKVRTQNPQFNEEFQSELLHNTGRRINFTVFHDSALPPDEFVANCTVTLTQLKIGVNKLWLDLEPCGRLHLAIDLDGTFKEGKWKSLI
jgi:novel protein kinase C epsilon type